MVELVVQVWEDRPKPVDVVQVDQQFFREIGIWLGASNVVWSTPLSQEDNFPTEEVTYIFKAPEGSFRHGQGRDARLAVRIGDFIVVKGPRNPDDSNDPYLMVENGRIVTYTPADTMERYRPIPHLASKIFEADPTTEEEDDGAEEA